MAETPGSWLTKIKPFQAALIAGFLLVLLILGLMGRGNYSLLGLLSVDNRETDFQTFLEQQLADQEPRVRGEYLSRWIIAALNEAEGEDKDEQARLASSIEPYLRRFDFYTIEDRHLDDRLALRFVGQRVPPEDPEQAIVTRERIAAAAIMGILQLASPKGVPPPLPSLENALASLDYLHFNSNDLAARLRTLDAADPRARSLRSLLYQFEGPFRKSDLFVDAPAEFVEAIHALKLSDAHYYRHGLVTKLWTDAQVGEGIFTIEREVEVRVDPALAAYEAEVCEGERGTLFDNAFLLKRKDRVRAAVRAKPESASEPCRTRQRSTEAALTVWLSLSDAARLLLDDPRPLAAESYPIRGVVLQRRPSDDATPMDMWPDISDPEEIAQIAAELERLAAL